MVTVVEMEDIRLDIEERSPVENIDTPDEQGRVFDRQELHNRETDPVRPVMVTGGKDSPYVFIVQKRGNPDLYRPRMMEMVEKDEVRKTLDFLEAVGIFREYLDGSFSGAVHALNGSSGLGVKWRVDDPDERIADLHTHVSTMEGEIESGW